MALEPLFIKLLDVYDSAYKELLKRLAEQELRGLSTNHMLALIADVQEIVEKLEEFNRKWIEYAVPFEYQNGSNAAVEKLTKRYGLMIDASFGAVHQDAVKAIINDTYREIANATQFMSETLKEAIRASAKETFLSGVITGKTRIGMTKDLMTRLNLRGMTAYYDEKGRYIPLKEYAEAVLEESWVGFIDKAGRRWDLKNYAEMLTRTKVIEAGNQGTENRLISNGLDLVMITSHGAQDWCKFYEGRIFSLTGRTPGYPEISQIPNGGCPMHPRCRHSETPIIEKFEKEETLNYGKSIDRRFLGLNNADGHADQATLRKFEREYTKTGVKRKAA